MSILSEDRLRYWGLKEGGGDPITSQWTGVSNVLNPLAFVVIYLTIVFISRNNARVNLNIRHFVTMYNIFQVSFSFYIAREVWVSCSSYQVFCEPLHSTVSGNGRRMAEATWYFFISKFIDMFDTLFIILKGNHRQLSTLHVFHHSSMIIMAWLIVRHVPTGYSFFTVLLNSLVHVIMYSYYFLSSLGDWIKPYLWWKRYLTMLQLIQFFLIEVHSLWGIVFKCTYPQEILNICSTYTVIMMILFLNFYVKNYQKMYKQT